VPELGRPRLDVESCESTQLLVDTSLAESSAALSFTRSRIASDARYMSLRVLPIASVGIFENEPY